MNNFIRQSVLTCLFAGAAFSAAAQLKMTREQYINRYKSIVIEQMDVYGIPASVKMAQALFESDNGNSRLALEANNHFGIKCKSTWKGATISHDDDAKGECFRKYATAEESFRDHSEFLDKSPRYDFLFKLSPTDYKGWAYGLKQAGYATNPKYAEQLIKIIEDNKLYLLDEGKWPEDAGQTAPVVAGQQPAEVMPKPSEAVAEMPAGAVDVDNYIIAVQPNAAQRAVYSNNCSMFVVARQGDTFESIAAEFKIKPAKILQFNDVAAGVTLREGDMVYIARKSKRSENGRLIHQAVEGETMHSISQKYGIRLKNLCGMNNRTPDSPVKAGQQIRLM